jgi:putative DNA primase/helicase
MNYTTNYTTCLDDFRAEMLSKIGYAPPELVDSGALIRFDTDKPRNKAGWYVLHHLTIGGLVATFGDWKQGISHRWTSYTKNDLNPKEREAIRQARLKQAAILKAETERNHETARLKAVDMWTKAQPASVTHSYLIKKQVGAYGIKQLNDLLLIPLVDTGGYLRNLQTIAPDGTKRFLKSGIKKGMFALIGNLENATHAYLCEGFATASSIFEAYQQPVICALDAGNLLPVAQSIRAKYPTLPITLVADNDRATAIKTGLNVGIDKATTVANSVPLVTVQVPNFDDSTPLALSDFNDAVNYQKSVNI